eukprot:scaffold95639_cov19-Tisochrysis_lutea.AAC.2
MHTRTSHLNWSTGAPFTRRVALSTQCPLAKQLCRAGSGQSARGIEVELANGFKASFPETGSGLLWARSTGLKTNEILRGSLHTITDQEHCLNGVLSSKNKAGEDMGSDCRILFTLKFNTTRGKGDSTRRPSEARLVHVPCPGMEF